ncbi:MAG: serine/threonine-protein phosphatase [Anaerolineales bacterium]|nr:serine/threonine-protein phosphatase [Anaerolineales bacterium]
MTDFTRIEMAAHTDPGRLRSENQDAWALPPAEARMQTLGSLLVVADGVGGAADGRSASQEAVAHMQALFYADTGPEHPGDRLRVAVEGVNALNLLAQHRRGLTNGHLTTLVAVLVQSEHVWVANVGDSRAYLIQTAKNQRRQLTEDHSSHVRFVKAGILTEQDDPGDTKRIITQAIGLTEECQVDIYHYTWEPGDALVLCSDGLAVLPELEMLEALHHLPPAQAAEALVKRAVQLDGSDNTTVLIARWPVSI